MRPLGIISSEGKTENTSRLASFEENEIVDSPPENILSGTIVVGPLRTVAVEEIEQSPGIKSPGNIETVNALSENRI